MLAERRSLAGCALAAEVGPLLALAAVTEDAHAVLAAAGILAHLEGAAIVAAEDRGRVGHADSGGLLGLAGGALAAHIGPFFALAAVGEHTVTDLAIGLVPDLELAAVLLTEDGGRVGHPGALLRRLRRGRCRGCGFGRCSSRRGHRFAATQQCRQQHQPNKYHEDSSQHSALLCTLTNRNKAYNPETKCKAKWFPRQRTNVAIFYT